MIARLELELGWLADCADQLILGSGRGAGIGQVRERRELDLELRFDRTELSLEPLGPRGDLAHRRDLTLAHLLTAYPPGGHLNARVGLVLLGAQPLELGQ